MNARVADPFSILVPAVRSEYPPITESSSIVIVSRCNMKFPESSFIMTWGLSLVPAPRITLLPIFKKPLSNIRVPGAQYVRLPI